MAFQSAPNCAEAVINATAFGKPIANVLNFEFAAPYSQADLDNLSAMVDAAVDADYLPYVASNVQYQNVTVRGLTSIIDIMSIDNTNAGPGQDIGAPNPNNVTLCFRLGTGFTGRSARGRFYAMPTSINQMSDANNFLVTYADGIVTFLDAVAAGALLVGCTLCVLSRQNAGAIRPVAVPITVVSIDYRNRTVDSQRGRLTTGH